MAYHGEMQKAMHEKTDAEKLVSMTAVSLKLGLRLDNGRHYLMSTPEGKIKVEDALEAFGFNRSGTGELD